MSPARFSLTAVLVATVFARGPAPACAQNLRPLRGPSTRLAVGAPAAQLPGLNAYGPGINADETGRPYVFVTPRPYLFVTPRPYLFVTPLAAPRGGVSLNVYGPGIGADANGWPVYVRPWP